jgi:DNA-binding response OmpR family regulator
MARTFRSIAHAVSPNEFQDGGKTCRAEFFLRPEIHFVIVIFHMKILIAEDDQDSRELLTWILQKLGYQVIATANGKEAWEAYRRGRFRIVISDVLMPEIDGLELCRRIRLHKQSKYTYIIIITALIGKRDYLEGMEAGADDFVTKPFDPDELKARLRVAERIISFQEQAEEAAKNLGAV